MKPPQKLSPQPIIAKLRASIGKARKRCFHFGSRHSHFVAGGHDLTVRIFEFDTGKEVDCLRGHHGPVRCIRHNYNGTKFASGSEDGTIRIWQHNHLSYLPEF